MIDLSSGSTLGATGQLGSSGLADSPMPVLEGGTDLEPSSRPLPALFDTRQLLTFSTLAQTASFTKAARQLGVSQSAVSHAISDLENRVGFRLFERSRRQITLTLAGEHLFHHAVKIGAEMTAAHESLQALRNWGQIQLRVAAPWSICDGVLPGCLQQVRRSYPNARMSIAVADRREALAELEAGQVDVAICPGLEADARFNSIPLFEDELVFAMAPGHPWAANPPATLAAIGAEPLLTYRRNTYTWQLLMNHFAAHRIQPTIALDGDSMTTIREMARLGMGVAILARWAISADVSAGQLAWAPMAPRPVVRKWAAFSLASRRLSLDQSVLIEQLKLVLANAEARGIRAIQG